MTSKHRSRNTVYEQARHRDDEIMPTPLQFNYAMSIAGLKKDDNQESAHPLPLT